MTKQFRRWLLVLFVAFAFTSSLALGDPAGSSNEKRSVPEVNIKCPVEPTENASSEFEVTYQGKRVRFCCADCMEEFQTNPQAFLANLPQFTDAASSTAPMAGASSQEQSAIRRILDRAVEEAINYGAVLAALLIWGIALVVKTRVEGSSRIGKLAHRFAKWPVMSGFLIAALIVSLVIDRAKAKQAQQTLAEVQTKLRDTEDQEKLNFVTLYDYGDPPVPFKPPQPPALKRSYYRGNDERNPKLFNGGLYRTATFEVQLVDAHGAPVEYGAAVSPRDLSIRLETDRAPNTPNYFYTAKRMKRVFLTRHGDKFLGRDKPVDDEVPIVTLEPMQRWEHVYPLNEFAPPAALTNEQKFVGIIYVCERVRYNDGSVKGARMHFALQFSLIWQDGKLASSSEIWMGSLYRSRKLPLWKIAAFEWFSHEPLPVLPAPNQIKDPEVLGIADYEREQQQEQAVENAAPMK